VNWIRDLRVCWALEEAGYKRKILQVVNDAVR